MAHSRDHRDKGNTGAVAVEAVERALAETDHTRLPAWLVARIAVEIATPRLEAEFVAQVVAPLRAELDRLRGEVRRLSERPALRLI